ncbi:glycosyltransferase family 87 protein [Novosphingobium resinovorum]|uniref:glycosyltransferase family 87 protein n=1 Tax=Novosphingobium resinovorum TaxID=158500 RepID=UPI002ED1C73D|nr:glycosyltransferase family 87 protein [Novosphingobium resinovorum]
MTRWLPHALIGLSALLILHHLAEFAAVLREGVGKAALTLDFRTYMCGAADLRGPYDICHNGEFVSGFVYPPPSLAYFHTLSRLPIDTAFLIHTALCVAMLAMATRMVVRMAPRAPGEAPRPTATTIAAVLAALAIAPVGTSLAAGQVNILLMGAAVAGMAFAATDRPARAGIAIALGFWLKIYPGLVPALFLTPRKWRAAVATVIASAVIAAIGLGWAAPELYRQYFLELLPHAQGYTMPGVAQSLAGIAAHVEAGGGAPIQHFVPIPHGVQLAAKGLLAIGILLAMAHGLATREARPLDSLNLLLCASLVAAPNAWGYHYALIFPAILSALLGALARPGSLRTPLVLACWLALVVPAWTDPPAVLGQIAAFNVPFRARYALVALVLCGLILVDARKTARTIAAPRQAG